MPQTKRKKAAISRNATRQADVARRIAAEYCLLNFPTMYTAGRPQPPANAKPVLWTVPIIVVDSQRGSVGEVGELIVNVIEKRVTAGSPRAAILAAGKKLLPR
jgi:hypothetical protein